MKLNVVEGGSEKVEQATLAGDAVQANMLESINKKIDTLAKTEKVTKTKLGEVSREIIEYITLNASPDVATVNRLLSVLTPMNKKTAVLFFTEFLPHKVDDKMVFGGRFKGDKRLQEFVDKAKDFLANPENNIWTWAETNIKMEAKDKNYGEKIEKLVKNALNDKEEGIDAFDILYSVFNGGISLEEMFKCIADIKVAKEQPEKAAA